MSPMTDSPSSARPTDDGTVSRKTVPSELASVRRNWSISRVAALRDMAGSVAEAMATPNRPSGNCMNRNAY